MLLLWVAIWGAPLEPWSHYWLGFWFVGVFLSLIHTVQMLAIRQALQSSGQWRTGDAKQLLIFGIFALLTIRKRIPELDEPIDP